MFKGFYMATSGMLTQSRIMNTISNNISNASTPGYKADTLATTTFEETMISRTGNKDKSTYTPLNTSAMIRTADELVTNYTEGSLNFTERKLDFAVSGTGFFEIQTPDGETQYTRNGSFTIDNQGYLTLPHIGRVMGKDGPIQLTTDKISADKEGNITDADTGKTVAQFKLTDFTEYKQLQKVDEGMFENTDAANATTSAGQVLQGALERSNVSAMDEMMGMITSQRAFQSASQIAKQYDQLMAKAVELGSL
ncbi:flagellar hook-basal body protein [Clostridium aminobutyricum]|uniref:Flagellar hook-basal body protein n=1 Tax=Clostridium aminobutyricum TaxID=33953 RepID=A0A939D943_CLOAM|nr:flagellar hook-basal body protein [Clostridium aminobutyricum]MBN7773724.1 flagellar hook-basal body protein [Clostridium aminobutyricum]